MITRPEIEAVAAQFGAPETQIIRDHLISHVLLGLSDWSNHHQLTFFGGTALCRTWLPDLRLSEDIDLLVEASADVEDLRKHISSRIRRDFPDLEWNRLGNQHEVETWTLTNGELQLKVQFAKWRQGWKEIPLVAAPIKLRYSDLPDNIQLNVPTPSGFGVMKLMAWFDRRAPRDLYDLAALADAGHIDTSAVRLVKTIAGFTPNTANLEQTVPRKVESAWQAELGHQIADTSTAAHCLEKVRDALDNIEPNN